MVANVISVVLAQVKPGPGPGSTRTRLNRTLNLLLVQNKKKKDILASTTMIPFLLLKYSNCTSTRFLPYLISAKSLTAFCPQLPYLLLNSTGSDSKTRMHPVFFGESIEVKPKPEQEIK